MPFDDFVKKVKPMIYELVCECIKMSGETYQDYKAEIEAMINESGKPGAKKFWKDVFTLIESYRGKKREETTCKQ